MSLPCSLIRHPVLAAPAVAAARTAVTLALAAGALSGCGSAPSVEAPSADNASTSESALSFIPIRSIVGIAEGGGGKNGRADRTQFFQDVRHLGVNKVRVDFTWSQIEKTANNFDFVGSLYAPFVADATTNGIDILAVLDYGNKIYNKTQACPPDSGDKCIPDNWDAFVSFATATAKRFPDIHKYEVWNEPNNGTSVNTRKVPPDVGFWQEYTCLAPTVLCGFRFVNDPPRFADVSMRVTNALSPLGVAVAPGGTIFQWEVTNAGQNGQSGPDFMTSAFAANGALGKAIGAEAIHTYGAYPPRHPPEANGVTLAGGAAVELPLSDKIARMNGVYDAAGFHGKPTWITEMGWPNKNGVTEEDQARWLVRAIAMSALSGVELFYVYDMYDKSPNTDPAAPDLGPEDWFGLVRDDLSPKTSYLALQSFLVKLGDFAVTRRLPAGDPHAWVVEVHDRSGKRGWVAWHEEEDTPPVTPHVWQVPVDAHSFDMVVANPSDLGHAANAGDLIALGPNPVYIVADGPEPPVPFNPLMACNYAGQPQDSARAVVASGIPAPRPVTTYCDDASGIGEYQCDQFANRFMSSLNLPPVDNWVQNLACQICDLVANDPNLSRFYSVWGPQYRTTPGQMPQPNDLLVWQEGGSCVPQDKSAPGHVAVVTRTTPTTVEYIQQNWIVGASINGSPYAALPRTYTSWDSASSFFGEAGGTGGQSYFPKCWVHPECPPGRACNPGSGHNPCFDVPHVNNGLYCGSTNQTVSGFNPAVADKNTVYECFDGEIANEQHCVTGCYVAPPGQPDSCLQSCTRVPQKESGLFCGKSNQFGFGGADTQPGWLYTCTNSVTVPDLIYNCDGNGCTWNPLGADSCTPHPATDPCAGVVDSVNDGAYCGNANHFGFDPKKAALPDLLYTCKNRVSVRSGLCGSGGCVYNPNGGDYCDPGTDPCAQVPPSENGTFCSNSAQWGFEPWKAYTGVLYTCVNGHTIQTSACDRGCYFNPYGADGCNP